MRPAVATLAGGLRVNLTGFINVTPLKQITTGLETFLRLLRWGWRRRSGRRRVVLSYNLTFPPGLFTFLACRIARTPYVAIIFDVDTPGETVGSGLWFRLDYAIQKWLIPRLDGRIVISERIAADFAPGKPFLVVEGGLSGATIAALNPDDVAPVRGDPGRFVVGFAGTLNRANGVGELLGAMSLVRDPRFRLVVAGDGPMRMDVIAAADADARITYLGQRRHEEVLSFYRSCDLLANVRLTKSISTRYLFPSKLLEFCAAGVPVLTTRVGSSFSRFEEFVFVLEDETPEGVAGALSRIAGMRPDARAIRARLAQKFVVREMSWAAQARRIHQYLTTLSPSGGASVDGPPRRGAQQ